MKKIKYLALTLVFAVSSCDNYLDVNQSENNLSFDQVTPAKLLPGAQVSTYRVQATTMNQLGNVFMNSWTRNVQSYGNGFDKELQLNVDSSFYNGIWNGLYRNLKNYQGIIDYPNPDGKYDNYVAAAKICKAFYMQYIVDLYGKAPYTQAWKGNDNITPAYDNDYAIYQDLIANLEDARNLIANAPATAEDIAPFDVMLGGNMGRWTEFANTVQLRLCMRMSNTTGAVAAYRDTKLANIVAGPFLSQDVAINPVFSNATDDQASPSFNTFAIDAAGVARGNRLFITMTGHAYKCLQSYATTNYPAAGSTEIIAGSGIFYPNLTDPRSARLFTAGASQPIRRAVNQGSSTVDVGSPAGPYPGLPCRLGLTGHFNSYAQQPGSVAGYSAHEGYIMTYSEACFLQAEAAVRYSGLGYSGAQGFFDAGVTANFTMRVATMGSYLTSVNAKPNFGLTASTTLNQKLHAIMYQKWVALLGINAIESYVDYTRTGFPLTPLSSTASQTRKPYRLFYPVSEYVANSSNVPSLVNSDLFTINAKSPFWLQ